MLLEVDEEVSDESEGLLLHEAIHVLLADLDAGDIHALHIISIYRGSPTAKAGTEVGVEGTHRAYARRARDRNLYLQFLIYSYILIISQLSSQFLTTVSIPISCIFITPFIGPAFLGVDFGDYLTTAASGSSLSSHFLTCAGTSYSSRRDFLFFRTYSPFTYEPFFL